MPLTVASTAVHAVCTDSHLLSNIYDHLQDTIQNIASGRLVNSIFEDAVSPFLFRSLTISFSKASLARLKNVATTAKFAKGVRQVVWETLHQGRCRLGAHGLYRQYTTEQFRAGIAKFYDVAKARPAAESTTESLATRYSALQDEEQWLLENIASVLGDLALCLSTLTGLKDVVMIPLAHTHRFRGGLSDVELVADLASPFPLLALDDPVTCMFEQSIRFTMLLSALAASGLHLRRFAVASIPHSALPPIITQHYSLPGVLIDFRTFNQNVLDSNTKTYSIMAAVFEGVKTLKLDMSEMSHPKRPLTLSALAGQFCAALPQFLCFFDALEALDLRLFAQNSSQGQTFRTAPALTQVFGPKVFAHLRKLTLREMWFTPGDLTQFLLRHQLTLQRIELCGINLGGCERSGEHDQLLFSVMQDDNVIMDTGREYSEWREVAQACTTLPSLLGLTINGASVGASWQALSVFDMLELEEAGMDGRQNCDFVTSMGDLFNGD